MLKGSNIETVDLLLKAGSLPTTSDKVVGNAIQYAQPSGRIDIFEALGDVNK